MLMLCLSELILFHFVVHCAGHKILQNSKFLWRNILVSAQACFLLLYLPFSSQKFLRLKLFSYIDLLVRAGLARKIMRGIALALGGSPDEFEGQRAGDPFWVMRLIGYPGVSTVNGTKPQNDIGW